MNAIEVRADFSKEGRIIPLLANNGKETIRIDRILSINKTSADVIYKCKSNVGIICLLLQSNKWFLLSNDRQSE